MNILKNLMEQRAAKVAEMRSLNEAAKAREEKRMTAEESAKFDSLEEEVRSLDKDIHRAEVMEAEDKRAAASRANATATEATKDAELRAFYDYVCTGKMSEEVRSYLTPDNSAMMIPKEINEKIILGVQGQYDIMQKLGVRITPHAKTFVEPILTGNMALTRITVGSNNDEGAASFEGIEIKANDFRLPVIPISKTLLAGSDADIQAAIVALLTEYVMQGLTNLVINGDNKTPDFDAITKKALVVEAAGADAITYDDLVDTMAKVKAPHGTQGRASWAMASSTRAALMKICDKNGRPILIESVRDGEPDRLLGRPVIICDNIPEIGAGKMPLLYGDFSKYVLRIVQGISILVYNEEKYAKDHCIGIQAFVTADGKLIAKEGAYEPLAGLKLQA